MSPKFLRMAEMYKRFAPPQWVTPIGKKKRRVIKLSFSKKSLKEMYEWESHGKGNLRVGGVFPSSNGVYNGYAIGKQWMDITIGMWREDNFLLPGITRYELKKEYPEWFLNKVGVL